ncbi:MAG: glycosyltransferase family 2 protein, partial [Lachnospiraceae bacterium]|nr:glycosyltransferase family 2 protein [Lachnospiraceae bacterium]
MNGEDSLFLHDCLQKGCKIYHVPELIGEETPGPSTWFDGYTEKFFFDRGVLYPFLYGSLSRLMALRFLLKNRKEMCREISLNKAYSLMKDGIRQGHVEMRKGRAS